jgi:chitin disaccharide deacetylase
MPSLRTLTLSLCLAAVAVPSHLMAQAGAPPEVLLRLDDVGMNHSVNTAIERVAKTGMPFSVSVMFACPWYQEAVEMLKKYPNVNVGVHLVLNSEWRNYRWGPVLGKTAVPSLVDSVGYFLPSTREFLDSKYDLGEVERELDAQLQQRIAEKYRVGISRSYGEVSNTIFSVPIEQKTTELIKGLGRAERGRTNLWVIHVAERTPEMDVLFDRNNATQNSGAGVPLVAQHRQGELDAVLSRELAELVKANRIRLVTYEQLNARGGPRVRAPVP